MHRRRRDESTIRNQVSVDLRHHINDYHRCLLGAARSSPSGSQEFS
jgi:hypothetical protein